jgi:hypothetical protein
MGKRAMGYRRFRLSLTLLMATAAFPLCCHAQEPEAASPPAPPAAEPPSPVGALEVWIDKLAFAESGNRARLVHRDRDGQLYYGCLQFHAKTFRVYVKRFHLLPKNSRAETMKRIYDCDFQKRLAAMMIREDPDNWKHWRWTVEKRIGMPPAEGNEARDNGSANQ